MNSRIAVRILLVAFGLVAVFRHGAHAQPRSLSVVTVAPIDQREVAVTRTFVGTVMPAKVALIGSATDGRVIEFPFNAGDRVESGQPIAQLLTETIRLELAAAQAELDLRRQELAELENGSRPEEIEQAKARMVTARAREAYLAARRKRAVRLHEENQAISAEERDEIISLSVAAEQAVIEAEAAYKLAVAGPRQERIAQARAQVAMQLAKVQQLEDRVQKHTVISRFSGYVTKEHTEVGQWLQQGDPVAEVAFMDQVEVVAEVVEQDVPPLKIGTTVSVEIPAISDHSFQGQIVAIVPQGDVQARTFPVKIRIDNVMTDGEPLLKSGMYGRVKLPTRNRQAALLVPKDALVLGGSQRMVYVFEPRDGAEQRGTVRPVPVELGLAEKERIQVISPSLAAGQWVVVQGNERLRPNQEVKTLNIPTDAKAAPETTSAAASPASSPESQ